MHGGEVREATAVVAIDGEEVGHAVDVHRCHPPCIVYLPPLTRLPSC
jgi:hypothetical protein